jgi:spermidine synthase
MRYNRWFFEALNPKETHTHGFLGEIVFTTRTKYQVVEVIENPEYGKILFIDSRIQSAQADEFIYHEALVHPGINILENIPTNVFIAGGGEGATLREVIKYKDIQKIIMVDIDKEVVEFAKENLREFHQGAFFDPRVELYYEDAREFLTKFKGLLFDIILIDIPEPAKEGASCFLFTKEFYDILKTKLTNTGLCVIQAGPTSITQIDLFASIHKTLSCVFKRVIPYQVFIPSFSAPWGFMIATSYNKINPTSVKKERIKNLNLKFYDEDIHQAIFVLPKFIKEALKIKGEVITDKHPLLL